MINNKYIYKIVINTSSGVTLATIRSIFNYPPFFFEFEGLASTPQGWELLCSVVDPDARDTPLSTKAVFRMAFNPTGALTKISPPVRNKDGSLYTDYAAALDVLDNGLAIVPAFHKRGVVLVNWEGRVVRRINLPTQRVEGVVWDPDKNELYLVRECVGEGSLCNDGVHFGVPLWIVTIADGLAPSP